LRECLKLRVKDLDFGYRQILVRDGKGAKDRVTILPGPLVEPLQAHLLRVRKLHDQDLVDGCGEVELPDALARKYPRAPYEWAWKFVFPSYKRSADRETGVIRRHHVYENYLIRGVKEAARAAGIAKHVSCHTLRHYAECRTMPSKSACGLGGMSRMTASTRHSFYATAL
jgi:integrase